MTLRDRPTSDLIMLALTALTVLLVMLFSVAVIVIEIWRPEDDIGKAASRIAVILTNLITGIFAYTAGRNTVQRNDERDR